MNFQTSGRKINFCTREGYLTAERASFSALMSLRPTNAFRCFTSGSEKLGSVLDFYQFQPSLGGP